MLDTPSSSSLRRSSRARTSTVPFDIVHSYTAASRPPPPAETARSKRQKRGEVLKAKQEAPKADQDILDAEPSNALPNITPGVAAPLVIPSAASSAPSNKRPWEAVSGPSDDNDNGRPATPLATPSKAKGKGKTPLDPAKERLARVRAKCPKTITDRFKRAISQRMFMLDREKVDQQPSPVERFKVLGSTGNVYTVTIGQRPRCDCPDCLKGNMPCKHIIFVYIKALKVDVEDTIWYQKSLTAEEAIRVFSQAPPSLSGSVAVSASVQQAYLRATGAITEDKVIEDHGRAGSKRTSAIGEDCPVCYEEMTAADDENNMLVYDEAVVGCGRPLHKECFTMWSATTLAKGGNVTCVWCRAPWPADPNDNSKGKGKEKASSSFGKYINLADQAGISRQRDVSSYHLGHRYISKD